MIKIVRIISIVIMTMRFLVSVNAQAPLPVADLRAITTIIQSDFGVIDDLRMIGMTDDPDGRFDVIAVGGGREHSGWRVEVLSASHHRITKKWDSTVSAREIEYTNSSSKSVIIKTRDYDYDLVIEGCAPHVCYDGISGFLLFSGKSGETIKAKLVTRDLEKPSLDTPKYDVRFSGSPNGMSKMTLEDVICQSKSISNRSGLPFECKRP